MKNKLYVGNLSYQMEEEALKEAFGEFGNVLSVRIITDRDSGRSKGFGFVEMETPEAAQACIEGMDGKELDGRNIRVSEAREQKPRSGGGGGNRRGGGNR